MNWHKSRPMTVREFRHFSGKFKASQRLKLLIIDDLPGRVDFQLTVEEAINATAHRTDDEDLLLSSNFGIMAVIGFVMHFRPFWWRPLRVNQSKAIRGE